MIEIRNLTNEDIAKVSELLLKLWVPHSKEYSLINDQFLYNINRNDSLKKAIHDSEQEGFVAFYDGELVGFVRCELKKCPDFYIYNNEVYIDDLIVSEEFRHKGIASKLIEECVKFASKNNTKLLTSKVWKFNNPSRKLFEKLNFNEDYSFYSFHVK